MKDMDPKFWLISKEGMGLCLVLLKNQFPPFCCNSSATVEERIASADKRRIMHASGQEQPRQKMLVQFTYGYPESLQSSLTKAPGGGKARVF